MGISFMIGYTVYLIQVYTISTIKYNYSFNKTFYIIFLLQFLFASISLRLTTYIMDSYFNYIFGSIVTLLSLLFSLKELNKRINIKSIFISYFNKNNK